jgi:L-threonylcarbamoyladenylate synthase
MQRLGKPLAAPSANRFGRISPTTARHVLDELGGRIPCILDGGPCVVGIESTIAALRDGGLEILRSGPLTPDQLAVHAPILPSARGSRIEAPGQLASHYAPATRLALLPSIEAAESWPGPGKAGLLAWSRAACPPAFSAMEVLTPRGDPREAAASLFAAMRRLDTLGLDLIVAEPPPPEGLGAAILDRLRKAAAPRGLASDGTR